MPAQRLSHLTLNTGHVATTPKDDVLPSVIACLRPVVALRGGRVPGMPDWHLALLPALEADARRPTPWTSAGGLRGSFAGAAYFQISAEPGLSKRPAIGCMACWRADASAEAWRMARQGYEALRQPLKHLAFWREPPPAPPPAPWLAVHLTPFVTAAEPADLRAFGDLERCLFWTLAEGGQ